MILIIAEHDSGRLSPINTELLRWGRQLTAWRGGEVTVALFGHEVSPLAAELAAPVSSEPAPPRADRVIVVDDPALDEYTAEAYTAAAARLVDEFQPTAVITGHTSAGYDFMPRLAARLGRPLIPGCVDWEPGGDQVLLTRGIFNSRLHMRVALQETPLLATALPGAFSSDPDPVAEPDARESDTGADEAGSGGAHPSPSSPAVDPGERLPSASVDFGPLPNRVSVVERGVAGKGSADLGGADIIVAAGRGLKEKENLAIVRDLADALGGVVGASRPVVDAEWMPREYQIGSSGQTVAPKLYVAVGISGAVQHLVGMQSARCIVAINKDADAPIFKVAHYGIVDDLFKVVPEITQTVRALRGSAGPKPV